MQIVSSETVSNILTILTILAILTIFDEIAKISSVCVSLVMNECCLSPRMYFPCRKSLLPE